MRPDSELAAVRWEHVFLNPIGNASFGHTHVPRGKTKNSERNLSLIGRVKEILERRFKEAGTPKDGYVFSQKDRSPVPCPTIDSQHDRTLKQLSFKFRIYDFRHTLLTRLGKSGADTIMKLAGHGSVAISQRYVHPTPEKLESAVSNLDTYNKRQGPSSNDVVAARVGKLA